MQGMVRFRHFSPQFWLVITLVSAAAGLLFNLLTDNVNPPVSGAIYGVVIGILATMYERGILLPHVSKALQRLPTLAYFVGAEMMLLAVILVAMVMAGTICWLLGVGDRSLAERAMPTGDAVIYSLAVGAALTFVLRMRDLIGVETFGNFMLGRYHRPVEEERAFLFIDMKGSTAYAERHGDLAAQELLGALFVAIAEPVRRHGGRVDDYVGDLAIVSWPLKEGTAKADCVRCVFAIHDAIATDGPKWRDRFGEVPEVWAALHGGSVVTAEVGVDRHKIAYFGDVMNATARLEALCSETGEPVLISKSLFDRLQKLPDGVTAHLLGSRMLRGRESAMTVMSLRRALPQRAALRPTAEGRATRKLVRPI